VQKIPQQTAVTEVGHNKHLKSVDGQMSIAASLYRGYTGWPKSKLLPNYQKNRIKSH